MVTYVHQGLLHIREIRDGFIPNLEDRSEIHVMTVIVHESPMLLTFTVSESI